MTWIAPYNQTWTAEKYKQGQKTKFELIDDYLKNPPSRILDIGAGYAGVSQLFQEKYNCEIFLLDGDFDKTSKKRRNKFGKASTMSFYASLKDLRDYYDSRGLKYTQIDANNIDLDENINFDLVYSFLSCGFHYPVGTYADLIKQHTDNKSTTIMDIRRKTFKSQGCEYEIIDVLNYPRIRKYSMAHIKLQ